jgi:FkbM family methyltransferase
VSIIFENLFKRKSNADVHSMLPRGIDPFVDVKKHLPGLKFRVVFDVGANVGQSAQRFTREFPGSTIYCFEPVEATYRKLEVNLRDHENVLNFRLALGAAKGPAKMVLEEVSEMSHLLGVLPESSHAAGLRLQEVELESLDGFCERNGITSINFLKIDTEGGDDDILRGAESLLKRQLVDVIQVEAGMNRENTRHVPLEKLKTRLEDRRYFLFGIYEQVNEWPTKEPHLRRTNPIFISEKVIKANIAN